MGETLAYGIGALAALLLIDVAVRALSRRPAETSSGRRMLQGARLVALFLLAGAVATSCRTDHGVLHDVLWMGMFGLAGMLALELAQALGFALLRGLGAAARSDNLAAAIAATAHTLAIGVLIANVAGGTSFVDLVVAALSFAVGQATLLLLLWLFRCLTTYDDREQILGGNVAAGLSHGGLTLALALLIAHATDGDYQGAWPALRDYGIAMAEGLVVWPLRQLLVQCLLFRSRPRFVGGELDRAVAAGDFGAGTLEAATYLGLVLFVRSLGS
ncbi:MAG: DUF350 domain-containing protein [Planctomycetota bacterium]